MVSQPLEEGKRAPQSTIYARMLMSIDADFLDEICLVVLH